MTPEQTQIIKWAKSVGGRFTTKEANDQFGSDYHHNGAFHVGERLGRMVDAGLLIRVKRGFYTIGKGTKSNPANTDDGQTKIIFTLF